MTLIPRTSSAPLLYPVDTMRGRGAHCPIVKSQSLTELQHQHFPPRLPALLAISNEVRWSRSRQSLHSSLDDGSFPGSMTSLFEDDDTQPGDLRKCTPSPNTQRVLADCGALAVLPRDRPVWTSSDGRLQPVPDGSAEHLLMQRYGPDAATATALASTLRRGGFHPGECVWTAGDIADAMSKLGPRDERRGLPDAVCAETAAVMTASMARDEIDPWHQFALDLGRNPYTLNGMPETSLQAFQQAASALPAAQQRLVHELHQGLLARLEHAIYFGSVLHRGGALPLSNDGSRRSQPRPDTRFHLRILRPGTDDARALLTVEHERPLSSVLPAATCTATAPEQATLAPGSAYRVTLRACCSGSGVVTVSGEHAIRLRYPETAAAEPCTPPSALGPPFINAEVHGQLTADIMDLHALAVSGPPHAVALHLAAIDPDSGVPRIAGLLALARALEGQADGHELLPADLARFAFAELRRCADHAREVKDHAQLALLRQAIVGAGNDSAALAHPLPGHGHWRHARQECCSLLALLLYRSAGESDVPALDTPDSRLARQQRDGQLSRLIQIAGATPWEALNALLPVVRFGMWRTTGVQRPEPCSWQHGSTSFYLAVALRCLNALGPRVAPLESPARTIRSDQSPAPVPH